MIANEVKTTTGVTLEVSIDRSSIPDLPSPGREVWYCVMFKNWSCFWIKKLQIIFTPRLRCKEQKTNTLTDFALWRVSTFPNNSLIFQTLRKTCSLLRTRVLVDSVRYPSISKSAAGNFTSVLSKLMPYRVTRTAAVVSAHSLAICPSGC